MIDGELGALLRSRRESTNPADVDLPEGVRRRTPGLRRSELATLAGISVEYLVRLEQGRDTRPSTQVLDALAEAMRLTDADRDYLQQLAVVSNGTELCQASRRQDTRTVRSTVHALLAQLDPTPAVVLNHLSDLLAWNDGYDRLARPIGILDTEEPNLAWFILADRRARAAFPDWDDVADEQVARLHQLRHGDTVTEAFAARLTQAAGEAFTDRWRRKPVVGTRIGVTSMAHPDVGILRLASEPLQLADHDQQQLVTYLPADATTATGLDRLAGRRPGGLHSVSDEETA